MPPGGQLTAAAMSSGPAAVSNLRAWLIFVAVVMVVLGVVTVLIVMASTVI